MVWWAVVLQIVTAAVAIGALALSVFTYRRTLPLQKAQKRLTDLEIREKEEAFFARRRADIRAEAYVSDDRIVITNVGQGTAMDVNIVFLDKPDPLVQSEREEKLPIEELPPEGRCGLIAGFTMGNVPPYRVALTWKNANGAPQSREQVLYGS